ncbi:MAG: LON peptidase substrate-binding domain-containing protein [Phycisphaerales bacterium]
MNEQETIRVNFGKAHPVFPLNGVTLLPHAIAALYIFEPRYRQMIQDVLDTSGQIAMATYDESTPSDDESMPPIRPVVCLGQVVQHEKHPDGTYHVFLQGVCRAEIVEEIAPDPEMVDGKLYRRAVLQPMREADDDADLAGQRETLSDLLESQRLSSLPAVQQVKKQLSSGFEMLPTPVLMDVVALSLLSVVDEKKLRHALLEEPSSVKRADLMIRELRRIDSTLRVAELQFDPEAPKGISWN